MRIKNIKLLATFFAFTVLLSGCAKEENEISKITFWPDIQINGDSYVVVELGDTYTDESATVSVGGAAVPFETTSDVNTDETGVYTVVYTAVNEDGISASQTRTVVVVDPDAADDDLTGSFTRVGQAGTVIDWVKNPSRAFAYIVNNVGGVPPSNSSYAVFNSKFAAYNVAPSIVVVPLQTVPGGLAPFFCSVSLGGDLHVPFNVTAAPGDVGYEWVVNGANFGTGPRTFKKL